MPYRKQIICLANSFKTGGHCIAGKELSSEGYLGDWIRPVSDRSSAEVKNAECMYADGSLPCLLDIIEIQFLRRESRGHQTENHVLDPAQKWKKINVLDPSSIKDLLESPDRLWVNSGSTSSGLLNCVSEAEAAEQSHSLVFIHPQNATVIVGASSHNRRKTYMCEFWYSGMEYRLKLTDPVYTNALASKGQGQHPLGDVFLCISLTEPWEQDGNRCYKLVAGVVPNSKS